MASSALSSPLELSDVKAVLVFFRLVEFAVLDFGFLLANLLGGRIDELDGGGEGGKRGGREAGGGCVASVTDVDKECFMELCET